MTREVVLTHHGVKGMKWGVRRAARQQNRSLNKASKAKDKEEHAAKVDAARARSKGKDHRTELKTAKQQYHQDKVTLGSREAKKKLNKVRNDIVDERALASQPRDGKEAAQKFLLGVGAKVLISSLA